MHLIEWLTRLDSLIPFFDAAITISGFTSFFITCSIQCIFGHFAETTRAIFLFLRIFFYPIIYLLLNVISVQYQLFLENGWKTVELVITLQFGLLRESVKVFILFINVKLSFNIFAKTGLNLFRFLVTTDANRTNPIISKILVIIHKFIFALIAF